MSTISAANTIQQTNAAYLAQLKAARLAAAASPSAASSSSSQAGSFASTLSSEQSAPLPFTPLPPPTALTPAPKTAVVTPAPLSAPVALAEKKSATAQPAQAEITRRIEPGSPEDTTNVPTTDEDLSVDDLVDLLNPLQHIPIVGTIYRAVTGDTIKPDVQVVGSVLFGLATGSVLLSAASGIASAIFEQNTGEEPTVQVARAIFGDEDTVQLAAAAPPVLEEAENTDKTMMAAMAPPDAIKLAEALPSFPETIESDSLPSATTAAQTAQADKAYAEASSARVAPVGLLAQTGGMRVGNTIYASPQVRSATRITATNATKMAEPALVAAPAAVPSTATTLGDAIHQQALAGQAGQSLPPELIQDMMLKALDKYTAAQNMAAPPDVITAIQ